MQTIQQQQAAIIRNQARVIDLLKWNMAAYSAFLYNSGLQYLEKYMRRDEDAIRKLTPRKEFWNWWKTLWNARDEAFIQEWDGLEDEVQAEDMRTLYRDIHNVDVLVCEVAPPSIAYPNDFSIIKKQMA